MHSLARESRSRMTCRRFQQVSKCRSINDFFDTSSNLIIGKEQLEALKNMKKVAEPILTAEEKASKTNKAEIKGTGF